jgi:hypothetical protein
MSPDAKFRNAQFPAAALPEIVCDGVVLALPS